MDGMVFMCTTIISCQSSLVACELFIKLWVFIFTSFIFIFASQNTIRILETCFVVAFLQMLQIVYFDFIVQSAIPTCCYFRFPDDIRLDNWHSSISDSRQIVCSSTRRYLYIYQVTCYSSLLPTTSISFRRPVDFYSSISDKYIN